MEELDYWRLCDELNIVQSALLIAGQAPNLAEYAEEWDLEKRPDGYEAAKTAISHALRNYIEHEREIKDYLNPDMLPLGEGSELQKEKFSRSIKGRLVPEFETDINGNVMGAIDDSIDLYKSTVEVESLKRWLAYRGFQSGFFFPEPVETLDYLDPLNLRYAPKLAAAIRAWQAVTDAGKRSPKQALDKWLREHAAQFGLTNDEGKPVEQAIEECSKVANWNAKGGATKTPS